MTASLVQRTPNVTSTNGSPRRANRVATGLGDEDRASVSRDAAELWTHVREFMEACIAGPDGEGPRIPPPDQSEWLGIVLRDVRRTLLLWISDHDHERLIEWSRLASHGMTALQPAFCQAYQRCTAIEALSATTCELIALAKTHALDTPRRPPADVLLPKRRQAWRSAIVWISQRGGAFTLEDLAQPDRFFGSTKAAESAVAQMMRQQLLRPVTPPHSKPMRYELTAPGRLAAASLMPASTRPEAQLLVEFSREIQSVLRSFAGRPNDVELRVSLWKGTAGAGSTGPVTRGLRLRASLPRIESELVG